VLEARHELQVAAAAREVAASAARSAAAAIAGADQTMSDGGAVGKSAATLQVPPGASASARVVATRAPTARTAAANADPPSGAAALPPVAALRWCGDHRGWQAAMHLAAVDFVSPDGPDTPSAASALTAKAAKLLADAATDEALEKAASIDGTAAPASGTGVSVDAASSAPLVLVARTSTSMTFALPAAAAAAAAAGRAPGGSAAKWVLLGKPFGSGTAVTSANTSLRGSGIPLPAIPVPDDASSPSRLTATVSGLTPNMRYNFAWGWSAASTAGRPTQGIAKLAGGVSPSTTGLIASTPLCLDLLWARLLVASVRAGDTASFAAALRRIASTFLALGGECELEVRVRCLL
jgi:hypothetical protein